LHVRGECCGGFYLCTSVCCVCMDCGGEHACDVCANMCVSLCLGYWVYSRELSPKLLSSVSELQLFHGL
jgi:hypothetical protein